MPSGVYDPVSRICDWCGSSFLGRANSKYCSVSHRDKARYRRDRDKRIRAVQEYRAREGSSIRARRRADYAKNTQKYRDASKKSYLKHRATRISDALAYQKARPEVRAAVHHKRRDALGGFLVPAKSLLRTLRKYGGRCAYCQVRLTAPSRSENTGLQWDHVVPLSRGGRHSIGNLLPACKRCNQEKNAKTIMEWKLSKISSDRLNNRKEGE